MQTLSWTNAGNRNFDGSAEHFGTVYQTIISGASSLWGYLWGRMVVVSLAALCPLLLPLSMQFLGVLFGAIQAFVFTLLTAIYLEEATAVHH